MSWSYITESAKIARDAADHAAAPEPGPALVPQSATPFETQDQKWEMVIPKMPRPPAKPAFAPRQQLLPEPEAPAFAVPSFAAPPPPSGFAPVFDALRSEFLKRWRRIPNSAIIAVVIAWVFLLIIAVVGGAFR